MSSICLEAFALKHLPWNICWDYVLLIINYLEKSWAETLTFKNTSSITSSTRSLILYLHAHFYLLDTLWHRIRGTILFSNWDVHGNFYRHKMAENIWNYCLLAPGMCMETSIDTLWQRISETIFRLSNWDVYGNFHRHLVAKNIWNYFV